MTPPAIERRAVGDVLARVGEDGHAVLRGVGGLDDFRALATSWAPVLRETHVRVRPDVRTYLCRPGEVPFHTDHPDVGVIAWFCVSEDTDDGANLLIDGLRLVPPAEDERALLAGTMLGCPALDGTAPERQHPVLRAVGSRMRLYYAPWHAASARTRAAAAPLLAFEAALAAAAAAPLEVRLRPGDVLVVDNGRMLHGRRAVGAASGRHLVRLWLGAPSSAALAANEGPGESGPT